jgi:pimeloyl-ACP methyl ester carboxylesterase
MPARALRIALKFSLWTAVAILLLGLLAAVYVVYLVYSFDTETLPERHGQVDSQLYAPAGPARPLLVGLGGAEGGNSWARDRWTAQRERFAEQGYAFLALGYFGLPNTPEKLDRIALDGVHRAILQAQADPAVSDQCVILIGGSKGAELALAMAAHYPDISAVVALAPGDTVFPAHTDAMNTSSWSIDAQPLPFAPIPWSATLDLISGNLLAVMDRALAAEQASAALIPAERSNGPIQLIAASDDEMWPSLWMAERLRQRLHDADFAHGVELVEVSGGHEAVIDHFDRVEAFLQRVGAEKPECRARNVAPVPSG